MEQKRRVLLVDDAVEQIRDLAHCLSQAGFTVLTCTDGEEAIAAMEGMPFDAVVSDIQMPNVNGLAVFEWTSENRPQTRIIAMTAYDSPVMYAAAINKGAIVYLEKPVDPKLLIEVLNTEPMDRQPKDDLLASCLEAVNDNKGGEVVVRSGEQVGRILFNGGQVVWTTLASSSQSFVEHLASRTGQEVDSITEIFRECRQTGHNFINRLVDRGTDKDLLQTLLFEWVVTCVVEMSMWPQRQSMYIPNKRPFKGDVTFDLSQILSAARLGTGAVA